MDTPTLVTVIIFVIGAFCALIGIIYNTLNNKTVKNEKDITHIKEKFITKEDSNRATDKIETKIDKIIDMLMEGSK